MMANGPTDIVARLRKTGLTNRLTKTRKRLLSPLIALLLTAALLCLASLFGVELRQKRLYEAVALLGKPPRVGRIHPVFEQEQLFVEVIDRRRVSAAILFIGHRAA